MSRLLFIILTVALFAQLNVVVHTQVTQGPKGFAESAALVKSMLTR